MKKRDLRSSAALMMLLILFLMGGCAGYGKLELESGPTTRKVRGKDSKAL